MIKKILHNIFHIKSNGHKSTLISLKKRDCGINMRLVPCGGGWTDVYMDICGDSLYFIISSYEGHQFDDLIKALYHMYPMQEDPESASDIIKSKIGIMEWDGNSFKLSRVVDETEELCTYIEIPWKAEFTWSDEERTAKWILERTPNDSKDFNLNIKIEVENQWFNVPDEKHEYNVRYKDMCYAVAKACTEALKKHGFFGYHTATHYNDINIRHLLFLKSVAMDNFEAKELTYYQDKGKGETSNFEKEIELLLMDM